MITPRQTRLVRVPDLHVFRRVVTRLATSGDSAAGSAVLVPTGGASRQLRRTMAQLSGRPVPTALEILTRDEWYEAMAAGLPDPPRRLTAFERDSLAQAAAVEAANATPGLPFQLRPGLIVEILRFYDALRRQGRQVQRFEDLIQQALEPAASAGDRGAGRMQLQTRFLAATFRGYETRLADQGLGDEHALRARLLATPSLSPIRRLVATVADWIADPAGLFPADFDLLARIPGLERIDLVCTDATLSSGFHQRLRDWLPGLDEIEGMAIVGDGHGVRPVLVVPGGQTDRQWHTVRDRAEELAACARRIKADRRADRVVPLDRIAIVYRNPLPYLYLARETLDAAGVPWQSADALPLAGEPTAAAVDLVLDLVETSFTRNSIVSLLRSPHFALGRDGTAVSRTSIAALDRALSDARYLGDLSRFESLALEWRVPAAAEALEAALAVARQLAVLLEPAPASKQLECLRSFFAAHLRPLRDDDPFAPRERRARTDLGALLDRLVDAHARHHDPPWTIEEVAPAVRRWIGEQTFAAGEMSGGVHLLDDQAARYGDFDDIAIAGLAESEWPERTRRNIFYPASLLKALGWPTERDRRTADDARFLDLVASASSRVVLSTFTLDDERLVARSVQLDEIPRAGLSTMPDVAGVPARIFIEEALTASQPPTTVLPADLREWTELRMTRPSVDRPDFHGSVGPREPRAWSVSALETYVGCPFKFFAQHVLALEEEPEDEEIMAPRRQGLLVHDVFETFFDEWQRAGHGNVSPDTLDAARALFTTIVDRKLAAVPDAEAGLERTRLLGSPAAAGLGEAVFRMEAERPVRVVERLLEHRLDGAFEMDTPEGSRTVRLRGKADRIDLLEDGTFRVIDYKLGWPPSRARALQLPIYGLGAEQRLTDYRGRAWTLGEAAYLAFKGPKRVVPLFSPADRERVLADARARLIAVVDAVERGEFPPAPDDIFRCETCSFTSVCRKDYVGDTA